MIAGSLSAGLSMHGSLQKDGLSPLSSLPGEASIGIGIALEGVGYSPAVWVSDARMALKDST